MTSSDLVETLELWRTAVREVDAAPVGTPERAAAEALAEQRRLEYRAAALRSDAQAEDASEATSEALGASFATIDDVRGATREFAESEA